MNLDKETKEKIERLPLVIRTAAHYLIDALDNIINGKCSEDTLTSTLSTLNNNSENRICNDDVVNYDKACNILGLGNNRNKLKEILDKYGVKQVKINNQCCGFLRSDVMAVLDKIKKKNKRYNKRGY